MAKTSKSKKKSQKHGNSKAQQFLIWHGEKIVVGVVVAVAVYFAVTGLVRYRTLSWQPDRLTTMADDARIGIERSTRTAEDENIKRFDYAEHAKQIRDSISADPYRGVSTWHPAFGASVADERFKMAPPTPARTPTPIPQPMPPQQTPPEQTPPPQNP